MDDEQREIVKAFREHINMTPMELERWLQSEESKSVGQKENGGESTGHASGRRIVAILGKRQADYSDGDIEHMRQVTGYIKRHLAQRPSGDVTETPWRYSLMNWGHDPKK